MKLDTVLVLDFGGQYTHLIARRVREHSVYAKVVDHSITVEEINRLGEEFNLKGLILSGGPPSVFEESAPRFRSEILDLGVPVLGLCYGHQLLAYVSKGVVKPALKGEYGIAYITIEKSVGILEGLASKEKVWMSHGDTVYSVPEDFEVLAYSSSSPVAAFKHRKKPIYGLQWHPEVVHTEHGTKMLRSYLFKVCGCNPNWKMREFVNEAVKEIRRIVGDGKAVVGLSGGIDSSTVTALAAKAIGKQLTAVFVDHGFMRHSEPTFVRDVFSGFRINFVLVDAKERFLKRLKGIVDPEQKRKIIGEEFIRVFEEEARKIGATYLLQGTIYPDRIESGVRKFSDKIKSHHNVAGLPTKMDFKEIVEPLRDLYKDEVRKTAEQIGLPREIVWRQPFPGPGLAVRIIGEVTAQKIKIVRKANIIVEEEIEKSRMSSRLWQYFAVLTNTKSTGVKGDSRAYGYTIAVRAVESREAMTANFAEIPYHTLQNLSTRIVNEIQEVTRVVYDITHKPPATIEWE